MSNLNGFVKLHRKMVEWGWYSDCVTKDTFIHILMVARYEPGQFMGYELKAGQAVIGRKKMAAELGFSEQQIRTALKKLESTGEITLFSTNKFTIATVENWEFYQCDKKDSNQRITNNQPTNNQQITNEQPTNNQQVTTYKERKKERREEGKKERIYIGVPPEIESAFREFSEMRKKIKKPITTETTVKRILNKLDELASTTEDKIAILNQSTDNCWQDVYELKQKPQKKGAGNPYLDMLNEQ